MSSTNPQQTINSLNPLKKYIEALIENVDKETLPKTIDLILDGGAFNGGFLYGVILYLKELEKLKLLKIDRVSGCSIGAILGVVYLTNTIDENITIYEDLLTSFRETMFLDKLSSKITKLVTDHVSHVEVFNDRLFITYYDIETMKQIVVSKYKNKEELIEILIRSTYLPFVIDGNIKYNNSFCDGMIPYIFPKSNKKVLFVYLITLKKIKTTIFTKNEVNIWAKLLNGIVDINNFLSGSHSDMCCYINNWTYRDFFLFRFRESIVVIIIFIIKLYIKINDNVPDVIKRNIYLSRLVEILRMLYKDIMSYFILYNLG